MSSKSGHDHHSKHRSHHRRSRSRSPSHRSEKRVSFILSFKSNNKKIINLIIHASCQNCHMVMVDDDGHDCLTDNFGAKPKAKPKAL